MAVPVDHCLESRRLRLEIELRKIVQHVKGDPAELEHLGSRQLARPCSFVDVATDRGHGSNRCKLVENFRIAHIAGMNDVPRSAQSF